MMKKNFLIAGLMGATLLANPVLASAQDRGDRDRGGRMSAPGRQMAPQQGTTAPERSRVERPRMERARMDQGQGQSSPRFGAGRMDRGDDRPAINRNRPAMQRPSASAVDQASPRPDRSRNWTQNRPADTRPGIGTERRDRPDRTSNPDRTPNRVQSRPGPSEGWRNDRRDPPRAGVNDRRINDNRNARYGWDNRDRARPGGNWDRDWRRDQRYDWQQFRNRYGDRYRHSYRAPRGWTYGYSRFSIGISLWSGLYASSYWINDPYYYRLPPAYGSLRWVRYYDDALLVDIRTGQVVDVIYDFFW